jgi:hypothetical protein
MMTNEIRGGAAPLPPARFAEDEETGNGPGPAETFSALLAGLAANAQAPPPDSPVTTPPAPPTAPISGPPSATIAAAPAAHATAALPSADPLPPPAPPRAADSQVTPQVSNVAGETGAVQELHGLAPSGDGISIQPPTTTGVSTSATVAATHAATAPTTVPVPAHSSGPAGRKPAGGDDAHGFAEVSVEPEGAVDAVDAGAPDALAAETLFTAGRLDAEAKGARPAFAAFGELVRKVSADLGDSHAVADDARPEPGDLLPSEEGDATRAGLVREQTLSREAAPAADAAGAQPLRGPALASLVAEMESLQPRESRAVKLRLKPEELGEVRVELTRAADGTVSASLTAERPEAARALSDNLAHLREALRLAGVEVGRLDVGHHDSQPSGRQPSPHGGEGRAAPPQTRAVETEDGPRPATRSSVERLLTLRA